MAIAKIICDGGLDLVTAKEAAAPGSLRDCLNYEVANRRGYTKSKGLSGYSGGLVNDVGDAYVLYLFLGGATPANVNFSVGPFATGVTVTWGSGGTFRLDDGTLAPYDGRGLITFRSNSSPANRGLNVLAGIQGRMPVIGDVITDNVRTATVMDNLIKLSDTTTLPWPTLNGQSFSVAANITNSVDSFTDLLDAVDAPRTLNDVSNGFPLPCAGNGYVPGGFYWKDRLHVVADLDTWAFTTGTVEPAIGHTILVEWQAGSAVNTTVERITTTSGSWAAGTAAGTIEFGPYSTVNGIESAYIKTPTGATFNQTTSVNAPFVITARKMAAIAGLYRDGGFLGATGGTSGSNGWERLDLGHEVRFRSGGNFFNVLNRAARDPALEAVVTATAYMFPTTETLNGWSNATGTVFSTNADFVSFFTTGTTPSPPLVANTFGFSIPATATILGVEVKVTKRHQDGGIGQDAKDYQIDLVGIAGTSDNKARQGIWDEAAGFLDPAPYGSPSDCWNTNLTPSIVNSAAFGVRVRAIGTVGSTGGGDRYEIDSISVKITYKPFTSTVYFRDTVAGTDVATGKAIWYYRDKGTWSGTTPTTAEGVLTVYGLTSPTLIRDGMEIRSAAGGVGTLHALAGSVANKVYMEPSNALETNGSQYEFKFGNFFSQAQSEQVFGVSGASFAFSWDSNYCIRIRTGVDQNLDKPRHVEKHLDQLMLGYATGVVMASDLGYPESFAGVVGGGSPIADDTVTYNTFAGGAQEIAVGDPVYGLMALAEQSLGVFCRRSLRQIVGSGGALVQNLIAPDSGIIEYMLVNAGVPVFLDYRGFGTITATNAFGDFARGRLSDAVSPWLVPRLQEAGSALTSNRGPVRVELFRAKNQVRVYFRDRYCMTMTFVGNGFDNPQFTIQQLPFAPTFTCSGVTTGGKDRVFCGTYAPQSVTSNNLLYPLMVNIEDATSNNINPPVKVYEMDIGTTWDRLLAIPGYFELNGGAVEKEWQNKHFSKMVVGGLMYGFAPFGVNFGQNFGDVESTTPSPINAGSTTAAGIKAFAEQPFSVAKAVNRNGYALAIKFTSNGDSVYGATTTQTSPYVFRPMTIQSVTLFVEPLNSKPAAG